MNEVLKSLETRRSIRSYLPEQIRDEELNQVLEAGTYAPTGMGRQSPVMVAVQKPELGKKLSQMNAAVMGSADDPFYGAPTVIVVLANADVLDQNEYILKTDESGNLLGNRLKPGDIIRYATDRAGYATELEFVFDSEKLAINGINPSSTNFRENKNYMYASIYSRVGNEMKVTVKDVETEEIQRSDLTLVVTDRTNVIYRWDPVRQRFQKITSSDLIDYVSSHTDYSKAFIQLHVGEPRTIVVYE